MNNEQDTNLLTISLREIIRGRNPKLRTHKESINKIIPYFFNDTVQQINSN